MFTRIVVGTDGSETAAEAVRQAVDLARLSSATLSIVSAYEPVSERRVAGEQQDVPADVQHEIGPREDVNLILDAAAAEAKKAGIEVQTHPVQADPADAILNVAEETGCRPDRRRQQGDDRRPPLPPRQRPQQRFPSRSLQRDHRPNYLGALSLERRVGCPRQVDQPGPLLCRGQLPGCAPSPAAAASPRRRGRDSSSPG